MASRATRSLYTRTRKLHNETNKKTPNNTDAGTLFSERKNVTYQQKSVAWITSTQEKEVHVHTCGEIAKEGTIRSGDQRFYCVGVLLYEAEKKKEITQKVFQKLLCD